MNRSVSPLLPLVLRSLLRSPIRILLLSALLLGMVPARAAESAAPPERLDWWREAAFGMFIHWGVYTIPGRGEWIMYQEHIPAEEYAALAEQFQPRDFNPREWVALAKASGMKYVVITTRHHDGYCLFDSQVSDFTSVKTGAKRDFIAEFVAACREADMRIGFYYSLVDWRFPGVLPISVKREPEVYAPMIEQAHAQVRELLTNYGKIDILWYDMLTPADPELWRSEELNAMARELQPDILINNRAGVPADFETPENTVTPGAKAWESCYTMNRSWAYCPYDTNYKTAAELIRLIAACASNGGNLLLNVSPDREGKIPGEQVDRLREIGQWMNVNGRSIYGAVKSPIDAPSLGMTTRVGNKVYLQCQRWPGVTAPLAWFGDNLVSAKLLSTGQALRIEQRDDRVWLHDLPAYPPDRHMNVIELTFDGEPKPSNPPFQ
jgi:alpha-L-fucosidase